MNINFTCPTCGQAFSVSSQLAGTQAMCNSCGATLTVPAPSYPLAAAPAPQPSAGGGIPRGVWIAVICVAALTVLGILSAMLSSALFGTRPPTIATNPGAPDSNPFNVGGTPTSPGGTQIPAPYVPPQPNPTRPGSSGSAGSTGSSGRNSPSPASASNGAVFGQSSTPKPESDKTTSGATSGASAGPPSSNSLAGSGSTSPASVPKASDTPGSTPRERRPPGGSRTRRPTDTDNAGAAQEAAADWVPWKVPADPAAAPIDFKKGKISIPVPRSGQVLFPRQASNFVLISGRDKNNRETWQVYDLRTSKEIGKPIIPDKHTRPALFSPDGRYLITDLHGLSCNVWSFVDGKLAHELKMSGGWGGQISFAGPHQLLATEWSSQNLILRLFDLRTGDKLREFSVPAPSDRQPLNESLTVTPGGRYALILHNDRLAAYDLNENQCAGHARLPGVATTCQGVACTSDGSELAALITLQSFKPHLVCWDLTQGQIALDYEYDEEGQSLRHGRGDLSWLPDKSGLLYQGNIFLDRETGTAVWEFPSARGGGERRMLSLSKMLATLDGRNASALTTVDLPEKDLKKALESVRGGGKAVDAILPRLIKGNVLSASAANLPNGFVAWAATPDAAGVPPRREPRDLLVAKDGESLKAVVFAAPDSGKVAVQKSVSRRGAPGRPAQHQNLVERYDLQTGQKSQEVPLPLVYDFLDISPSGNFAITGFRQQNGEFDRLDVIGFSPRKHVAGWRPYESEAAPAADARPRYNRFGIGNHKSVKQAAFLDDEHVLTVSGKGKLMVWKLPDCQAVYYFEDFGLPLAFSPRRKYMLAEHNSEIRLFDTLTGEGRGDLEMPKCGPGVERAAFRPEGTELAAVVSSGLDKTLVRWSLTTGKLLGEFPLPSGALTGARFVPRFSLLGSLEWRGARFLLLDSQYLIDLTNRAVVWRYHVQYSDLLANNCPDERTWLVSGREANPAAGRFLVGLDTPSLVAREKTDAVTLERQLVLGPGMRVRLDIQVGGTQTESLRKTVGEALQARGIIVDPAAALAFSVATQQGATGVQIGVSKSFSPFARPETTFTQEQMSCVMSLRDSAGKQLWTHKADVQMRSSGMIRSENAQAELGDEMRRSFDSMLSSGSFLKSGLPTYVFGELDQILAGSSTLKFGGEGPPPPPPKPANPQMFPGV